MTNLASRKSILREIQDLTQKKGFIYAILFSIYQDFHVNPEKLHKINTQEKLSTNEASLFIGYLIKNKLDLTPPNSPEDFFKLKNSIYRLAEKLHNSFLEPFIQKLTSEIENPTNENEEELHKSFQRFFADGELLIEPIFYASDGVYNFQYLDFLEPKYKYDKNWLRNNKNFELEDSVEIVRKVEEILQVKSRKVNFIDFEEIKSRFYDNNRSDRTESELDEVFEDTLPIMELYQFAELFGKPNSKKVNSKNGWSKFYSGLIDLFTVSDQDLSELNSSQSFLENFSIVPSNKTNKEFKRIGDFNEFTSAPLIKYEKDKFLVPIHYLLCSAVYESPFYWMGTDDSYKSQLSKNRGQAGEDITYNFLSSVFGTEKTYKSIKIQSKKGTDETDIDILCTLGSYALCVQVKSKKLTLLSRKGDIDSLKSDFQKAVQDAYDQGLKSKYHIKKTGSKFFKSSGEEIHLSEDIDTVLLMVVTTENYPSLPHQAKVFISKKESNPYPIVLTIFDLELLSFYLKDPYEFMYYIRQRINCMEFYHSDEEMKFLGFHLTEKLWQVPSYSFASIDSSYGQLIDRNYYPFRAGLKISDKGDVLKTVWKNEAFDKLCDEIKQINEPKITDILFHLYDGSNQLREDLVKMINKTKRKTINDKKDHNFAFVAESPEELNIDNVGYTYLSSSSNDPKTVSEKLLILVGTRKYSTETNFWIGFGSSLANENLIDTLVYDYRPHSYDPKMEQLVNQKKEIWGEGRFIRMGEKIGRNDPCPCGSGRKNKHCCKIKY